MGEKAFKVVSLGSRAHLCVHPEVRRLKHPVLINEKCIEMKQESSASKQCPYLEKDAQKVLRDFILTEAQDIEDLFKNGRSLSTCPYYASRASLKEADLILLPYPSLLNEGTRDSLGLNMKNSVVIIDEAHNLIGSIARVRLVFPARFLVANDFVFVSACFAIERNDQCRQLRHELVESDLPGLQ